MAARAVEETTATIPGSFTHTFDPWGLPLVNTLGAAALGCTVTWAHHALLKNDRRGWSSASSAQSRSARCSPCCSDRVRPCRLQLRRPQLRLDVLHGDRLPRRARDHRHDLPAGVPVRALKGHFTPKQHFGFEAAAWYWHFVDVVWLFLFACIYVWGAGHADQCPRRHRPATDEALDRHGNQAGRSQGCPSFQEGCTAIAQRIAARRRLGGRCPRCGRARCSGRS